MKNLILFIAICFVFFSCSTVKQSISITPIPQTTVTSASDSLIINGKTITNDQYAIINEFSFEKSESIPRKTESGIISFSSDLEDIRQKNNADAIVDFKLQFISVNHLNTNLIMLERCIGFLGLTGVIYGLDTYINQGSSRSSDRKLLIPSAIIATSFFGGSVLHDHYSKIEYKYVVSGKLVKIKEL